MPYATPDDFLNAFPNEAVELTNLHDALATEPNIERLQKQLNLASAQIDSYLRQRYVLPLDLNAVLPISVLAMKTEVGAVVGLSGRELNRYCKALGFRDLRTKDTWAAIWEQLVNSEHYLLKGLCLDIARYGLAYNEPMEDVRRRYDDALATLRRLNLGDLVLNVTPPIMNAEYPQAVNRERQWDGRSLAGYGVH